MPGYFISSSVVPLTDFSRLNNLRLHCHDAIGRLFAFRSEFLLLKPGRQLASRMFGYQLGTVDY
jgi:O-antigen ligase